MGCQPPSPGDGGWRRGKPGLLKPTADVAVAHTPSIEHVVVVDRIAASGGAVETTMAEGRALLEAGRAALMRGLPAADGVGSPETRSACCWAGALRGSLARRERRPVRRWHARSCPHPG